jgi:hypothetical protein
MNISVPQDGRPQFSFVGLALANYAFGRPSLDEVQQIGPDRYILPNAWPTPKAPAPSSNLSSAVAASVAPAETKPRSAGQALWPHLP